jgi:hypothetical protein
VRRLVFFLLVAPGRPCGDPGARARHAHGLPRDRRGAGGARDGAPAATAPDPSLGLNAQRGLHARPRGRRRLALRSRLAARLPRRRHGAHALAIAGSAPSSARWSSGPRSQTGRRARASFGPDRAAFELRAVGLGLERRTRVRAPRHLVHILTGYDHLLFLLLLVLLLQRARSVLLAETAFTLSHSLSFSATALGWIHVSSSRPRRRASRSAWSCSLPT